MAASTSSNDEIPTEVVQITGAGNFSDTIDVGKLQKDLTEWDAWRIERTNAKEYAGAALSRLGVCTAMLKNVHGRRPFTPAVARHLWTLFKAEVVRGLQHCAPTPAHDLPI